MRGTNQDMSANLRIELDSFEELDSMWKKAFAHESLGYRLCRLSLARHGGHCFD